MPTTMLRARDVMQKRIIAITENTPLQDVARILCEHQISGAPVQESDGKILGIISLSDIALAFFRHRNPARLVARDAMTPGVLRVSPHTPIKEVAGFMHEAHLHRLLVYDDGHMVGIISSMDLVGLLDEKV